MGTRFLGNAGEWVLTGIKGGILPCLATGLKLWSLLGFFHVGIVSKCGFMDTSGGIFFCLAGLSSCFSRNNACKGTLGVFSVKWTGGDGTCLTGLTSPSASATSHVGVIGQNAFLSAGDVTISSFSRLTCFSRSFHSRKRGQLAALVAGDVSRTCLSGLMSSSSPGGFQGQLYLIGLYE